MKTREEILKELKNPINVFSYHAYASDWVPKPISFDDVEKVLTAPTQARLNCPYCHGDKQINLCYNLYLDIIKNKGLIMETNDYINTSWVRGHITFDCCPKCGRKLGDE